MNDSDLQTMMQEI
jgi:chromosome segregation ATPase